MACSTLNFAVLFTLVTSIAINYVGTSCANDQYLHLLDTRGQVVAVSQRFARNLIIFPSSPEVRKILSKAGLSDTIDMMKCHRRVLKHNINIMDNRIVFVLFIIALDYDKICSCLFPIKFMCD